MEHAGAVQRLPDDLLAKVLALVDAPTLTNACSLVCRRWADVLRAPCAAWQDVAVSSSSRGLGTLNVGALSTWFELRGAAVQSLKCESTDPSVDAARIAHAVLRSCPACASLEWTAGNWQVLKEVIAHCPGLRRLVLHPVHPYDRCMWAAVDLSHFGRLPVLEELWLEAAALPPFDLAELATMLPHLTSLRCWEVLHPQAGAPLPLQLRELHVEELSGEQFDRAWLTALTALSALTVVGSSCLGLGMDACPLPPCVPHLTRLQSLALGLLIDPPALASLSQLTQLTSLQLDASWAALPLWVTQLTGLVTLNLGYADGELSLDGGRQDGWFEVPVWLTQLTGLRTLRWECMTCDLPCHAFFQVPACITALESLQCLVLGCLDVLADNGEGHVCSLPVLHITGVPDAMYLLAWGTRPKPNFQPTEGVGWCREMWRYCMRAYRGVPVAVFGEDGARFVPRSQHMPLAPEVQQRYESLIQRLSGIVVANSIGDGEGRF